MIRKPVRSFDVSFQLTLICVWSIAVAFTLVGAAGGAGRDTQAGGDVGVFVPRPPPPARTTTATMAATSTSATAMNRNGLRDRPGGGGGTPGPPGRIGSAMVGGWGMVVASPAMVGVAAGGVNPMGG